MTRIGLVGAGRRMMKVYVPLLEKLMGSGLMGLQLVGFTTRTEATAQRFTDEVGRVLGIKHCKSIAELAAQTPDFMIVCVKSPAAPSVIRSALQHRVPLLIETPVEDASLVSDIDKAGVTVGVVEQWPYLPLEQFKEEVYRAGWVSRPFLVKNDCRSFDYHAMAQLRTYIGRQYIPSHVVGTRVAVPLVRHLDMEGNLNAAQGIDSWELGTITMSNGAVIDHQFSYKCKTAPFRSIQSLRAYSIDGTIVTGRIDDRSNDYEIIDIERVSQAHGGATSKLQVVIKRDSLGAPRMIGASDPLEDRSIAWHNPYADIYLDDNEVAIATHIDGMANAVQRRIKPLYSVQDAVLDQHMITAIKYACDQKQVVRFG